MTSRRKQRALRKADALRNIVEEPPRRRYSIRRSYILNRALIYIVWIGAFISVGYVLLRVLEWLRGGI